MRSPTEHQEADFSEAELGVLAEVWRDPETTQRSLGRRLGISLGLTNHLVRKLVGKGYVRVVKSNWRRRFYAVTPKGMVQKVRLTLGYVGNFLGDYQNVKLILREELSPLALHKESRIAIYGPGDFGELVYLAVRDLGIEEVDVFGANGAGGARFLGRPVRDVADPAHARDDRVHVADLLGPARGRARPREAGVPSESIVTFFALPSVARRAASKRDASTAEGE